MDENVIVDISIPRVPEDSSGDVWYQMADGWRMSQVQA